jgi:penicillin-binding protein 1A
VGDQTTPRIFVPLVLISVSSYEEHVACHRSRSERCRLPLDESVPFRNWLRSRGRGVVLAVVLSHGYAVSRPAETRTFAHTPPESSPVGVEPLRLRALPKNRRVSRLAAWLKALRRHPLRLAVAMILALLLFPPAALVLHVYFDRSGLPDLGPFIRFENPTIGEVSDARGNEMIQLAREYRRTVSYDQVPKVLRDAILAAEDKNFLSHSGVDYSALPRVLHRTAASSLGTWGTGGAGFRLLLPNGGSTLTQQLVRGYFLRDLTRSERGGTLVRAGLAPRLLSAALGVSATNMLLRKLEEVRLTLWLEDEMRRRYGSQEQAKREIFARYANFVYLGNGRYGFAAASEYYFGRPLSSFTVVDAGEAALLAGISKSPRDYTPRPGDPLPLRRRNQILALMVRNGYIPEDVATRAQAEPIRVVARSPVKTQAPAAIGSVLDELSLRGKGRFAVQDLFQGRISVRSTVDERVQTIVNEALENGLTLYEKRRPRAKGLVQGSVVVLRNSDGAILAEAGGRQVFEDRLTRYSDLNRATGSLRQPGSAFKPVAYLAAFRMGLDLDTIVPDEPIEVPMGGNRPVKQIANYDNQYKGPMPIRQALAESRNAATVWITREIGPDQVVRTARDLGIRTPLQPYLTTALGASEVRLMELADAYRAMASGLLAEPHIIDSVTDASGRMLYQAARAVRDIRSTGLSPAQLSLIQEGLRGVVRLPSGTAHSLDSRAFGIPVMGKTGTTSDFRDALFVGSTYGPPGITVAVRIGFDDNRELGSNETGARTALPIFREIMLRIYKDGVVGRAPPFPREIERGIDEYLELQAALEAVPRDPPPPDGIID